ncbi:hypothetical protein NC651_015371 [Populus alba x Populus x berolinensis]|nr:hypothetical protein NC651_015371 [Populus alba x Populus x berolinensis]
MGISLMHKSLSRNQCLILAFHVFVFEFCFLLSLSLMSVHLMVYKIDLLCL